MKTIFFYFLGILLITSACTKVPNDGIPSYIKLTNPTIENSSASQGSTLHQFKDLWIQSGGESLGAFEYPVTIAALLKGNQDIIINPGIYSNENVAKRTIYPIYEPFIATYNFVQKDTLEISPIFKYRPTVDFLTIEDFENSNNFSNMERTVIGDVNNLENKAGVIILSSTDVEKNAKTITPLTISNLKRTYIEFTIKSDSYVKAGVLSTYGQIDLGVYKPLEEWQTFYYEITNDISTISTDQYYFFFDVQKDIIDAEENTYIDNFKIIQYQ